MIESKWDSYFKVSSYIPLKYIYSAPRTKTDLSCSVSLLYNVEKLLLLKAQHSENEDHGFWSHHFMGNRWGNSANSIRLILGGSKITADGDCSHEIKRRSLLGRKVMTNLDNIFQSRDITLPTKVRIVKAMVFPVVMYGCESWTVKKSEHQRIDAFELWCWRRLCETLGLQGDPTSPS